MHSTFNPVKMVQYHLDLRMFIIEASHKYLTDSSRITCTSTGNPEDKGFLKSIQVHVGLLKDAGFTVKVYKLIRCEDLEVGRSIEHDV